MTKRRSPAGLGPSGARLWREVTRNFTLRADEQRVLEDACREADLIDSIEVQVSADIAGGDFTVKGSQGQVVINPLISELRQHRATLASLLSKLKLPDEAAGGDSSGARAVSARAAANARWRTPHSAMIDRKGL